MQLNAVRTLTVRGQSQGLDRVRSDLDAVSASQQGVAQSATSMATATETSARRQLSAANAFERLMERNDRMIYIQRQLEREMMVVNRAHEQGAIDATRHAAAVELLSAKYAKLTAAEVAARTQIDATGDALDRQGVSMARLSAVSNAGLAQRRNLMFQLADIGQGVPLLFESPGYGLINIANQMTQVGQAYYGQGGMGAALKDAGGILGGLAAKVGPLIALAGALAFGFAALTTEINKSSSEAVSFGDVVQGSMNLAWDAFVRFSSPLTNWFGDLWGTISPYVSDTMVGLVQMFDLAYRDIGSIWGGMPAAMGETVIDAANWMIVGLEGMVNGAIELLNQFFKSASEGLKSVGIDAGSLAIGKVDFGVLSNPLAGANDNLSSEFQKNLDHVNTFDYRGMLTGAALAAKAHDEVADKAGKSDAAHKKLAREGLTEAQKAAQQLADTIERTLGSALSSLFDGPLTSVQEAMDGVLGSFAQLGQQNLQNTFSGLFSAPANDNGNSWSAARETIFGAVRDGSKEGTAGGFGDFFKNMPKDTAANVGAGLGGFGVGYQSQNPLMGAVGGALAGASAGPWGAVIGGVAGLIGGFIGLNAEMAKNKKLLGENKQSISAFIGAGYGKAVDETTAAVIQYKAQANEYIKLAKAAGDTALVNQLKDAAATYRTTLLALQRIEKAQEKVDASRDKLSEAYERESSALRGVIDQNKAFIASIQEFKKSLLLDGNLSPLSQQDRLIEAQSQFQKTSAAAIGGDAAAQGQLQDAARTYLEQARNFYASSESYVSIFAQVQSALDRAMAGATANVSTAERHLTTLDAQVAKLIDVNNSVLSVRDAIKAMQVEVARLLAATATAANQNNQTAKDQLAATEKLARQLQQASAKRP